MKRNWCNWCADDDFIRRTFDKSIEQAGTARVFTVLDHVSSSGMERRISAFVPVISTRPDGKPYVDIVCLARELKVRGCGMDMGFHLAYSMFCRAYGCSNKDRPYQEYLHHEWL